MKTIVNTNNNTLTKNTAYSNTSTAFEKYCQYRYFSDNTLYCFQHSFFPQLSINKVNKIVVKKMAK